MPAYFPIIYVRGFAFTQKEIEETTDDPTNGFNLGSTHARQGYRNTIIRFRFPGPFVRLMTNHGYTDAIHGYVDSAEGIKDPRRTLWIHRYYEPYSKTFAEAGKDGRPTIVEAATRLEELVEHVRQVCFPEEADDKRVILIAHSMGGLVCRSLIQKVMKGDARAVIEKVVTYGTPHGGIPQSFDWLDLNGLSNFSPHGMYTALAPEGVDERGFNSQKLYNFDAGRFLCVVGTNDADYSVGRGVVSFLAGFDSDGLVPIKSATVEEAPSVQVHRSHSGRYGLVNSAEAYAAVERFLFGGLRAVVRYKPPKPPPDGFDFRPITPTNRGPYSFRVGLMNVECRIGSRGDRVNESNVDHMSAVVVAEDPERIGTFHFLQSDIEDGACAFSISFRLQSDGYTADSLTGSGVSMMQDLRVWVSKPDKNLVVKYQWLGGAEEQVELSQDRLGLEIEVPASSFHTPPTEPMMVEIELTELDDQGHEPGTGGGFWRTDGGGAPEKQKVETEEKVKNYDLEYEVAGNKEMVGAD